MTRRALADRRTRRSLALGAYMTLVMAAAAFVLGAQLAGVDRDAAFGPRPTLFALFAVLLVAAESQSLPWLHRHEGGEVTASGTFAMALLLIAPAGTALATIALATAAVEIWHHKPLVRILFNAAQVMASFWLGITALGLVTDPHAVLTSTPTLGWVAAVIGASAVVFVTNTLLAGVALALHHDRPLVQVLRTAIEPGMLIDGLLLGLAPVVVAVARVSIVLEPLLVLTVWATYRSAATVINSHHDATHDALTGLPNRRLFFEQAEAALARAERRGTRAAVIHVDLDGFKAVNDGLGHHVGDLLLREVANRLHGPRRSAEIVARLGGDEFAVLVPRVESGAEAERVASRLRAAVGGPLDIGGVPLVVGASLGVALFPEHGSDIDTLLRNADAAMYRAKRAPGGVQLYRTNPRDRSTTRLDLLADLRQAFTRAELQLVFQPQVDLATGAIIAVEALVRWRHPRLGTVMPDAFVPALEQTELAGALTERVLELALLQRAHWKARGIDLVIAVNVSVRNLHDLTFPDTVARLLGKTDTAPEQLELEISERCMAVDPMRAEAVLADLRALGVRLAIDDFGTGYSSLESLRTLSVDHVKIDRSFVRGLRRGSEDLAIVRSIIDLAHDLGLRAVAEGVEDTETLRTLRDLGCDAAQGFVIARPADAPTLAPLLGIGTIERLLDPAPWPSLVQRTSTSSMRLPNGSST